MPERDHELARSLGRVNWTRVFHLVGSFLAITGLLYWMQSLILPLVLAVLFTFVLAPAVSALERHVGGRAVAVGTVVMALLGASIGTGWLLFAQVSSMVDQLPRYERTLNEKVSSYYLTEGVFDKLNQVLKRMQGNIARQEKLHEAQAGLPDASRVQSVRVVPDEEVLSFRTVASAVEPMLVPLGEIALAWVLVVFFLLRREDTRDRVMTLVGVDHLATTTRALDEAGTRISTYLMRQAMLNTGIGIVVGLGLYGLGVPYAAMFGFLAGLLRYIPYLGPWLAATLPLAMSLIAGDGWALFFIVLSFLLVIEFTTNMVLEPRLYGSGIGLTETATVVMVSFWTWLWGPLGLLVGMPLTATLSVFARYVPGMQAFNTLFGAEAAMDVHLSVYQRILAGRLDEALDLVEPGAEPGTGVYRAFDALLLPALARAQADYQAGVLSRTELADFNAAAQSLIQELAALQAPAVPREIRVLPAYPGRGEVNTLALDMLDHSLALDGLRLRVLPRSDAVAAAADAVRAQQSGMLLVSSFAPGSASHARQLCQRLRASQPNLYIIVGRWVAAEEDTEARALLRAAGADIVVATLEEARAAVLGHVGAEPMPLTEADAVAVLAT